MGKLIKVFLARSCSVRAATAGIASLFLLTAALFLPGTASAVADLTNMWPATPTIVSNSNAGTVSGKFTVGIGANRVMVVAVATRYSALPGGTPAISVTYGGQPLTAGPTTGNVQNGVALFYLKDTGANNIGLATSKTLTVTNTTTTSLTNMYASASVYNGIDQTATIVGTGGATGLTTAAASVAVPSYAMTGSYGLPGNEALTLYVTNWNGNSNPSSVTGYTEIRDFAGSGGATNNINLSAGYKYSTGTGNEAPSSTATANLGGIAAMTLNTLQKPTTNNSCGDCHGNPPEDVASRGAITGMFVGSHDKHAGGNEGQYGMACTYCHFNNTTYNHSQGYKNITGAKLPGNAYTQTKRVADSNSPTLGTCNNTYCHSTGRAAAQYTAPPNWGTNGTVNCLSCHAGRVNAGGAMANSSLGFKLSTTHMQHMKAPYTASNVSCNICHAKTATDAATLKQYTGVNYHADGKKDVLFTNIAYASYTSFKAAGKTCSNVSCHGGKTRGAWSTSTINNDNTCVHCHGVATTSTAVANSGDNRKYFAPGWAGTGTSTDQNNVSTDPRVGAHFRHLSSAYMAKKIKCNECHLVPSNPYDAGHFDSPRFASQTITFTQSSTANKNTTSPAYTNGSAAVAATCNTTYCHGSKMPRGDNTGTDKSPLWNAALTAGAPNAATCGRCHGNPPLFGSSSSAHIGSAATTSCVGCHKTVADATGNIISKAMHLNGSVDVQVDTTLTGACNKCHGNPPQVLKYGRYSGLVKPATLIMGASPANAGAHLKHQTNGMTCNTCHTKYNAGTHPDNKLQIFFRISSNTHTGWNTTSPRAPYGTYSGNSNGNAPVDTVSNTLVRGTAGGLNSCNVYCHGAWNGSSKSSNPRWTGTATCGSCHGATAATPPQVGTHNRHAGYSSAQTARQGYSFSCNKCHPNRGANDHVKGAVHVRFSTAVLGTNASYILTGATLSTPTGSRIYLTNKLAGSLPDGSCSNVSCHSTGRAAGMGTFRNSTTPTWGTTTRNCLYCHGGRNGATPARSVKGFTLSTTHYQHLKYPAAQINCQTCHSQTAKDAASLKDFSGVKRHINGKRDVTFSPTLPYGTYTSYKSNETGSTGTSKTCSNVSCHGGKTRNPWSATTTNNDNTCLHCHGAGNGAGTALRADKYNAAPGWGGTGISTDGITAATDIRVGAHFKHLSSIYTKKIKCNECHLVPNNPFDGTHMATQRYNSQTLTFGQASSANKNTTTPTFGAGTAVTPATCTNYCHGTNLKNGDSTAGTVRTPQWNQDLTTGGNCGKCHGNPPNSVSTSHNGVTPTTGCSGCHSQVVDGTGKIINKALHMNGSVEAVTACNGCHSYDSTDTWTTSYGVEGVGAHIKHINYLKTRLGVTLNPNSDSFGSGAMASVCGTCHTLDPAKHSTGTPSANRDIVFGSASGARAFGSSHAKYNGLSGTSSSVNPKSCSNTDCHYRTSPIWSTY